MADWVTISSLATAGGTLVLADATFASVRSANRAARAAESSMLAGLRPLLMPSRLDDAPQKIGFVDGKWLVANGAGGAADATDEAVYLGFAVRNAGSGIAVLHGWHLNTADDFGGDASTHRSRSSARSRATSTSPRTTSASGRARSATRRPPSLRRRGLRSRRGSAWSSMSSMATTKVGSASSRASR
jgi:hypothetical protein